MLVKPSIGSRDAVRQHIILVRPIPLQDTAHLLTKLPQISRHKMMLSVQKWYLLLLQATFE